MECTVTSQLDYVMNIIITLCASWHALDRACCRTINVTAAEKKTKNDRHRGTAACLSLSLNTVFADNAYVHIISTY